MILEKLRLISLGILVLFSLEIEAQRGLTPAKGSESLALGAYVANSLGIESMLNNQAGLTQIEDYGVILSTEQRFLLSELNIVSAGLAYNLNNIGVIGFMFSNFGLDDFREQKIGFAYARRLFDNLSIAGQLDLLHTRITGFGSDNIFTFEIGAQSKINSELSIGFHIFSPGKVSLNTDDEIPTRMNIGLRYRPEANVYLVAEVQKVLDQSVSLHGGVSYRLAEKFFIRAGANSNPTRLSFGFAYGFTDQSRISVAATNHEVLGLTPATSFRYQK